jgi:hypothetical protein
VGAPVTAEILQVDRVAHPATSARPDEIADLLGSLGNAEALAEEREHLRHEWERLELTLRIQARKDLVCGPDLDDIAAS